MTSMLYLPLWLIKYTLEKSFLALQARHINLPSASGVHMDLWVLWNHPPQPRPSWVWAYPLTENLPVRKCASFFSGVRGGRVVWPQVIEERAKLERLSVWTQC